MKIFPNTKTTILCMCLLSNSNHRIRIIRKCRPSRIARFLGRPRTERLRGLLRLPVQCLLKEDGQRAYHIPTDTFPRPPINNASSNFQRFGHSGQTSNRLSPPSVHTPEAIPFTPRNNQNATRPPPLNPSNLPPSRPPQGPSSIRLRPVSDLRT